jgi:hypothetical protein
MDWTNQFLLTSQRFRSGRSIVACTDFTMLNLGDLSIDDRYPSNRSGGRILHDIADLHDSPLLNS